jgi:hypothetical protein
MYVWPYCCRKPELKDKSLEGDDDDDATDPSPDMPTAGVRKLKPWSRYTKMFALFMVWLVFTVRFHWISPLSVETVSNWLCHPWKQLNYNYIPLYVEFSIFHGNYWIGSKFCGNYRVNSRSVKTVLNWLYGHWKVYWTGSVFRRNYSICSICNGKCTELTLCSVDTVLKRSMFSGSYRISSLFCGNCVELNIYSVRTL